MHTTVTNRLTGYVLIVASIILIVSGILPSITLPIEKNVLDGVTDRQWTMVSVLAFIYAFLMPFVITGLYARQVSESGILGLIGFILALVGAIFNICMTFDMAFVWPSMAVHAPALIDFAGPLFRGSIFSVAHNLIVYLGTFGFLVFGIAMIRANVFPRLSTILFTIGLTLTGVVLFPPFILRTIGSIIAAVSLFWMGVMVIRNKG